MCVLVSHLYIYIYIHTICLYFVIDNFEIIYFMKANSVFHKGKYLKVQILFSDSHAENARFSNLSFKYPILQRLM